MCLRVRSVIRVDLKDLALGSVRLNTVPAPVIPGAALIEFVARGQQTNWQNDGQID
jgi:hypothetical protein